MINVPGSSAVQPSNACLFMPSRSALLLLSCILTLATRPARSADILPPTVIDQIPPANAKIYELRTIEVFFDEAVSGVDMADLLVNGSPATNLVQISDRQFLFSVAEPLKGTVTISWAAGHGITDQAIPPNAFMGGSW